MSIHVHENKDNESVEAISNNFIRIQEVFYRPKVQVTFERLPEAYVHYTSLEVTLDSPSSKKYFKRFEDLGLYDIVDFFKKSLSEEISAGFAYPKSGEGILLTPVEINALYTPLLISIHKYR